MLSELEYRSGFLQGGEQQKKDKYEVQVKKAKDIIYHTTQPMITSGSVLGIKFNGGIALAGDVAGDFGRFLRFKVLRRMYKVNNTTVMTAGGDFADFQYIKEMIENKSIGEEVLNDGYQMSARSLHSWLTRIMYAHRNKFDPLWNNIVVAGCDKNECFLGVVDKLGLAYEDKCVTTGMGSYFALPLLRNAIESGKPLSKQDAIDVLLKSLEVLYYRDCNAVPQAEIAVITPEGAEITFVDKIESSWDIAKFISGYN